MKEPNANRGGKSLDFNGWGFRILFFKAKKSSEDYKVSLLEVLLVRQKPLYLTWENCFKFLLVKQKA